MRKTPRAVRETLRNRQREIAGVHLGCVELGDAMHLIRDTRPIARAHDAIDEAAKLLAGAADALLRAEALILLEEQREAEK